MTLRVSPISERTQVGSDAVADDGVAVNMSKASRLRDQVATTEPSDASCLPQVVLAVNWPPLVKRHPVLRISATPSLTHPGSG